jgi:hypothetical protein
VFVTAIFEPESGKQQDTPGRQRNEATQTAVTLYSGVSMALSRIDPVRRLRLIRTL